MEDHDLEIEIRDNGEVQVHIRGAKGEECLSYVEFLEDVVGPVRERRLTHEYYEPAGKVRVDAEAEQSVRDAEE
ncbi:MAG: DUF2997 domain-containing protein [Candidatus Brocadiaceae bacterium]|jgi:hypothetical protein